MTLFALVFTHIGCGRGRSLPRPPRSGKHVVFGGAGELHRGRVLAQHSGGDHQTAGYEKRRSYDKKTSEDAARKGKPTPPGSCTTLYHTAHTELGRARPPRL